MTWRWWSRKEARARHEEWSAALNEIHEIRDDVSRSREKLDQINEHVNKLGRLQYRTGQEHSAKLAGIDAALSELFQHQGSLDEASHRLQLVEERTDRLVAAMLRWLDDLDELLRQLGEDALSSWAPLLTQWMDQILRELSAIEVWELPVAGRSFDARFCEAAQSVEVDPSEGHAPYEVLQVLRRGFARASGEIIRKALVVTARERERERERSSEDES